MTRILFVCAVWAMIAVPGTFVQATSVGGANPRRVEITARRFTFDPGVITLKKGEPVVLVLTSADVAHGLRIRELGVEVKIPKGGTTEVRFTPEQVGDFVGHCYVFCGSGHGHMALTLHVVA